MNQEQKTNIILMIVALCVGLGYGIYENHTKKQPPKTENMTSATSAPAQTENPLKEKAERVFADVISKLDDIDMSCSIDEALGSYILVCSDRNAQALFGMKENKIGSIVFKMSIYEPEIVVNAEAQKGKQIIAMGAADNDKKKVTQWFFACGTEDGYGKKLKLGNRTYHCSLSDGVFTAESILNKNNQDKNKTE